nr:aminotransferase class V-fold PLP-dependent enzyme [uncultured Eubacterium sp.]
MIYLDNAATTRISEKAVAAMEPYLNERYGNPSGIYNLAKISKKVVEDTREKIANAINAKPENIFLHQEERSLTIGFWIMHRILEGRL